MTGAGGGTGCALFNGVMGTCSLQGVSKGQLLRDFSKLVGKDRGNTAEVLAYVAEIDRRQLYLEQAYPSMFAFCTRKFGMSEAVAAKRIRAGRAACRFPCILGMVRRGELHLSGVHQLAVHLTEENHEKVLRRAKCRTMREIEELIAEIAPKRDAVSMIRALPRQRAEPAGHTTRERPALFRGGTEQDADAPGSKAVQRARGQPLKEGELSGAMSSAVQGATNGAVRGASHAHETAAWDARAVAPARKARNLVTPLSPGRYRLQVTIGQEARDKLAELQILLSHQIPDGDPAAVIERALDVLLAETKKKRGALAGKPRAGRKKGSGRTRAIPAHVRREVFRRDEGRCAFVDGEGRRCESAWQLEFHHCVPYGRDGPHSTDNIELRCRAHNQYEAELEYGRRFMAARRRRGDGGGGASGPR